MPGADFEKAAKVRLSHPRRGQEIFSASLERDPGYLHYNRMNLVGRQSDERRLLCFANDGLLEWELVENPDWPQHASLSGTQTSGGKCFLKSIRSAGGQFIDDGTIQKFAEIEFITYTDSQFHPAIRDSSATYWFLQRPPAWNPYRRRPQPLETLTRHGDWRKPRGWNVKFRLTSVGYRRHDLRISKEQELIEIPGVEFAPSDRTSPAIFVSQANELWFILRILLSFRYKQVAIPLSESIVTPGTASQTWNTLELEPRKEVESVEDSSFRWSTEDFFSKAAASLGRSVGQKEILHAAVWGYTNWFSSSALESRVTNCVEAIERLVTVFEDQSGFSRDTMTKAEWRPLKRAMKGALDDLQISHVAKTSTRKMLHYPPRLTLQERIERMTSAYQGHLKQEQRSILGKVGSMIKMRNDIVHGRHVSDRDCLFIEALRARVVFEALFLHFVGCHEIQISDHIYDAIELSK